MLVSLYCQRYNPIPERQRLTIATYQRYQEHQNQQQLMVLLEKKIDEVTEGLPASYANKLRSSGIPPNVVTIIVDYIISMKSEINLSDHYRKDLIEALTKFAKYLDYKPFKDMVRDDVIAFLDSHRRPEAVDPLHKWIGTYNVYRIHLMRFFKWLYAPDVEHNERKKLEKPAVIYNIPQLKRKENSIYRTFDMWTQQDDLLFLRYCPSKRDKCYHAISRDLSARPHEILKLKIRDITIKSVGTQKYFEVVVN